MMKKFMIVAMLAGVTSFAGLAPFANAAAPVPCEDGLKTLDEALKTAKPNAVDLKAITELRAKADERCVAEDDRRADGFIEDAMKLVTKK